MFDKGVVLFAVLAVFGVWTFVVVLLRLLDVLFPQRVSLFLSARGLSVGWGSCWCYSTRWNALLARWGRAAAPFWSVWFGAGACVCLVVSCLSSLAAVLHLALLLREALFSSSLAATARPLLSPMLPLVNIPTAELLHYLVALLLATALHELGHALAATAHSCAIEGVGAALFVVFPAAFVDLRAQDLEWSSVWVRLKVHCAGAFHNLLLALAAVLILVLLPVLLVPCYGTGQGLLVIQSRIGAVQPGQLITRLNGCRVSSFETWAACRDAAQAETHQAFCASNQMLADGSLDHSCCEHGYKGGMQCFHAKSKMYCMSARAIVLSGTHCNASKPCGPASTCVDVSLQLDDRILWLEMSSGDAATAVLAGSPQILWNSLLVTDRIPRFAAWLLGGLDQQMEQLLRYTISLSSALALLNLLPVHYLDGSHVADAVWVYCGRSASDPLLSWIKTGMTVLLAANLLLSSKSLLK